MNTELVVVSPWVLLVCLVLIGVSGIIGTRIIMKLETLLLAQAKKTDRVLAELERVQGKAIITYTQDGWVIARQDGSDERSRRYVDVVADGSYTYDIGRAKTFATSAEAVQYATEVHFYTSHVTI
jgi:hypothetical protein